MAKSRAKSGGTAFSLFPGGGGARNASYGSQSTQPLHILCFLAPFLVLYELGSILYLQHPDRGVKESIAAYGTMEHVFRAFGVASFHIPSILVVAIFLVLHLVQQLPMVVRGSVLLRMAFESLAWTLPLLVFGFLTSPQSQPLMGGASPDEIASMPWQAKLTLSAGAGVYEELLFRLVLIGVVSILLSKSEAASQGTANTIGAFISAIAFALYHGSAIHAADGSISFAAFAYYACAGLYFACLFLFRGFGIAVASHFLYDTIVLVILPAFAAWRR
jgi:Type II CAAX prenyl endopeptidase Rce1-like